MAPLENDTDGTEISPPARKQRSEVQPTDPTRLKGFATFFKNYMSVSTIVVAAAPIPVGSLHLIPTFDAHRGLIMTLSSLLSFLLLAFVFFNRVPLGKAMFRRGKEGSGLLVSLVPLMFIAASVVSIMVYLLVLNSVVNVSDEALKSAAFGQIRDGTYLILLQVAFFACAELAFIIMALREYLQDLLGISDIDMIMAKKVRRRNPSPDGASHRHREA